MVFVRSFIGLLLEKLSQPLSSETVDSGLFRVLTITFPLAAQGTGLFRIRVKSSNLSATSWFPVFDDRSVGALPFWLSQHETLLAGIYDAGLVLIQP